MRLSQQSGKVAWAHALVHPDDLKRETRVVDIEMLNEAGELIVQCKGFHFRKAPRTALAIQSRTAVDHWLYEMQWEEKAHKPSSSEPLLHSQQHHGSWLLFCDQKDVGQQLAKQLRTHGEQCLLVFSDQSYLAHGPEEYSINPSCPEHFHTLLQEWASSCKYPYRGVVYLWALDALAPTQFTIDLLEREQIRIYGSLLHLVQALTQTQWNPAPHLWLITQNCQRVTEEAPDGDLAVAHAPVWGLGRVIAQEQPDLDCKMIDLPHQSSDYMDELLKELLDPDQEDQMAFRQHRRYVARLVVSKSDASYQQKQMQNLLPIHNGSQHTEGSFRSDSTYLITGGLGGLGMTIAEWMVENKGVHYLVLTGRSAPKPEISQIISYLERSGAQIGVIQADISKQEEEVLLARPPLPFWRRKAIRSCSSKKRSFPATISENRPSRE